MTAQTGRRLLIRGFAALAAIASLPRTLLALAWPEQAFYSTRASQAMKELFGTDITTPSGSINLSAPTLADNGALVPITIETSLPGVKSISIVVEKNPRPLAVSFQTPPGTLPEIDCRIKMAETSQLMAVVETESGLFSAARVVKVTLGGCA